MAPNIVTAALRIGETAGEVPAPETQPADDIKRVPQEEAVRLAVRAAAVELAAAIDRTRPPSREDLERHAQAILDRLSLSREYLGFAMVALSNEFWRRTFAAVPFARRLFLLPHCLRDPAACKATYDAVGLHCAACGSCNIENLQHEARRLGYSVLVAEGTTAVLMRILEGEIDAVLGVACLDSLEKSFTRVVDLGVPHLALPLLTDGCVQTEIEIGEVHKLLAVQAPPAVAEPAAPSGYLPLLRQTARIFQEPTYAELLAPYVRVPHGDCPNFRLGGAPSEAWSGTVPFSPEQTAEPGDDLNCVPRIALDWLKHGGKRLRPFVTVASYAVARHGIGVLSCGEGTAEMLPASIRRIALAIESLHKASLVHDDIEDDDAFRYGRPTLHRVYGVAQAVNAGDYLIGLGYRLIAGATETLGVDGTADLLGRLSQAHLELCRGQGTELLWRDRPYPPPDPADVLAMYALKTSPAFEIALYAGLRAAGVEIDTDLVRRFADSLGEAFQIRNDLDDWQEDHNNKRVPGQDAAAGRPTILRALAREAAGDAALAELSDPGRPLDPAELVARTHELYRQSGALAKTRRLLDKLRSRALEAAEDFATPDLRELMGFLTRMILPEERVEDRE